jgi:hypothetical protein
MSESNTVAGLDLLSPPASASSATISQPLVLPRLFRPAVISGGLWLLTSTLSSSPDIEEHWGTLTGSKWSSAKMTESHLLADENSVDSQQIRQMRLALLRAARFSPHDQDQRIAVAMAALASPRPIFALDAATWKWIAEDASLEDI